MFPASRRPQSPETWAEEPLGLGCPAAAAQWLSPTSACPSALEPPVGARLSPAGGASHAQRQPVIEQPPIPMAQWSSAFEPAPCVPHFSANAARPPPGPGGPASAAVPVSRRSPEWGWLEYFLQASVQSSRAKVRAAWSVANTRLAAECQQRCSGLRQVHCWVPVSELGSAETIQRVLSRGFTVGARGMSVRVGNLSLPGTHGYSADALCGRDVRSQRRAWPRARRVYELLLCRIGVGRSLLAETRPRGDVLDLPADFDSLFVPHGSPEGGCDGAVDEDAGVYPHPLLRHEYVVRDASQALPLYVVHLDFNPEERDKVVLPVCDNCGARAARIYCEADDACFCPDCDADVHSGNHIARSHVRVAVNRRPGALVGECPEHPGCQADQYCLECRTPLCPDCRSIGSHSEERSRRHRAVPLSEGLEHVGKPPPGEGDERREEESRLSELDAVLALVRGNGDSVQNALSGAVQAAAAECARLTEAECASRRSGELQAELYLRQAAWLDAFLQEDLRALPKSRLLHAWVQHMRVRDDIWRLATTAPPPSVVSALRLDGALRVAAGAQAEIASVQG